MDPRLSQLIRKYGPAFLQPALLLATQSPAVRMQNDAQFLETVARAAWKAAPLQLRMLAAEDVGWSAWLLALRPVVYDLTASPWRLRNDWEHRIREQLETAAVQPPQNSTPVPLAADISAVAVTPVAAGPSATPPTETPAPSAAVTVLGIDLGTTYSVVAHLDRQGRPTTIPNAAGELLTPSVVLFDDQSAVVGKEAVQAATLEPANVAECVKRDMGSPYYRKRIRGELLPPEVVSSYILRALHADAQRKLGPVAKCVITVPAYFDEPRRRATVDAGRLAGLEVLDIINEPTAAAIAYGYQEGFLDPQAESATGRPVRVLVFDLGGGTFDVTIVELAGLSFRALATDGDVRLGGKDWDEKLADLLAERFRTEQGTDPRANPESLAELFQAAENAKKALTERQKTAVVVQHAGRRARLEVSRTDFEAATAALLLRTRTTTELVVQEAGLDWPQIDRVLLVGGSTRMPAVGQMLAELSGRAPDRSVSPDEAVAHGAALYADLIARQRIAPSEAPRFKVTNVNSHSLGVVGVAAESGRRVAVPLIRKNSQLPCSAKRRFRTARENQPDVKITVVEGESDDPTACTQVGACTLQDLPPNLPAGWPVEIRFTYEENGRLQVEGKLVGHAAAIQTQFIRDNSLPDNDLLLWAECLQSEADRTRTT